MLQSKGKKNAKMALGFGAVVMAVLMAAPVAAASVGSGMCASRDKVIDALGEVYAEAPVSAGLTEEGSVIEVMASAEGSFTIVITHPNGLTCPIAAGTAWQSVIAKIKGEGV